ncbi:pentatricopeptide repeat-containing protein [Pyrus ussuriensis x Pyrus communis]|uniref:Pentatricopeptide repeat-containing protein n=1 Tax=Pyrus ussuriensis x Pyrus communis TaxID=2448454 RepID=A0A5N5FT56_9ROSA|nr:pentatricopeptide repeat-containing protein [Pyrus ussuriensis x Pyrus communis]
MSCISTRPKRNSGPKTEDPEVREVVRTLMRSFSDKEPLLKTLNKYVKTVRTEHCFMLFEYHTQVFRWMQRQRWYVADNGVYSKLISVMGKKGQTRMAMWLFSEMRNSGCRPDTCVYNRRLWTKLSDTFNKMKGMERCQPSIKVNALFKDLDESVASPDIYTYNGVMDAYGKNGNIREMESVLSRMKKLKEKAEHVLQKMTDMKYTPSFITYESLVMMYGLCDCVSKAREVFDRLAESGRELKFSTLNATLDVYCMNGLPMEANKHFVRANSIGANMKELLEKLLKSMENDGIVPNKRFFLEALGAFFSSPGSPGSVSATTGLSRPQDGEKNVGRED